MSLRVDKITYEVTNIKKSEKKTIEDVHKSKVQSLDEISKKNEFYFYISLLGLFLILQSVVSAAKYSGFQKPPMFGDFEAQRHWMEITLHLPVKEWYFNTSDNNLEYWGLDYPPLTAYHSLILGKISDLFDKSWVALKNSHGIESPSHLAFMRTSVIITMMLFYGPAIILMMNFLSPKNLPSSKKFIHVSIALLYPGLIFVDNGHFQYNHIALGFFVYAVFAFHKQRFLLGSVLFVLALNFKQMELYHALPIFVYIFSRSIIHSNKLSFVEKTTGTFLNLAKIGSVVIFSFIFLWIPFLTDLSVAKQVLHRLFPFARGIFEDKVANFWCCLNVVYKVKEIFDISTLAKISTVLVLISLLPSLVILFVKPSERNLRITLTISSLSFYLFSFQVHEKTILMAAIPSLFVLYDNFDAVILFLDASSFSMYSLCIKDENPEIIILFIFFHFAVRIIRESDSHLVNYSKSLQLTTFLAIAGLQLFGDPPSRYPHLFDLMNAGFSFVNFLLFFLYLNFVLVKSNFYRNDGGSDKKNL